MPSACKKNQTFHRRLYPLGIVLCLVLSLAAGGCGGGGSTHNDDGNSHDGGSSTGSEGTLSLSLSDTATDEYSAVYVTIAGVDVRSLGSTASDPEWETVVDTPITCNLLKLVNGTRQALGQTSLKEGIYSQMRLILGTEAVSGTNILDKQHPFPHYTISSDADEVRELKVPDTLSTGVALNSRFAISADKSSEIVIDFDASRSIIHLENTYNLLKPALKVYEPAANANISGTVSQKLNPNQGVEGCYISMQETLDTTTGDDLIAPVNGTLTSSEGNYSLLLEPGDKYTLVAYAQGYQTQCYNIADTQADATMSINLGLEKLQTATGSISGEVSVAGSNPDQRYATLQIRRYLGCQNEDGSLSSHTVIVKSIKIANQNSYRINLPPGVYQILAFAPENSTIEPILRQISINAGAELTQNIRLQ